MAEVKRPFKVLIVGGGPAGLSLALMLEKHDIDYSLFESHPQIECPGGAGIGIAPNGSYILDQLGAYQDVISAASGSIIYSFIRSFVGSVISKLEHFDYHLVRRHGYGLIFIDRLVFLHIVYRHIQKKDNIHVNSRIENVEEIDGGVQVVTKDGRKFQGDIVIGADGIHSQIRKTLRSNALAAGDINHFPEGEEDSVPVYYQCSFGIANDVNTWVPNSQVLRPGKQMSFLVVSGPGGRVYWFLFVRLPQTLYGKDIPRYTTEDEARFAEKHASVPITETLTFGQLFASRVSSALTPLHEKVFKKWFYKRTFLSGDSVHKPNPIGGMGGNIAMETGAELVNELVDLRNSRSGGLDGLSDDEITRIFTRVEQTRMSRAHQTIDGSHTAQALMAYENPTLSALIWHVLTPLAGGSAFIANMSEQIVGSNHLKHLPRPVVPHIQPYHHERIAKPIKGPVLQVALGAFALVMGIVWLSAKLFVRLPLDGLGRWGHDLPHSVSGFDGGLLLSSMLAPLLIFTIEGYRNGRTGTILSVPALFLLTAQFTGFSLVAPVYFLLSALGTTVPVDRPVPLAVARSLGPALVLSLTVPFTLKLRGTWVGNDNGLWLPAVLLSPLTAILSFIIGKWENLRHPMSDDEKAKNIQWYETRDIPVLKVTYALIFAIQAAVHITTLAYSYPAVTTADTFSGLLQQLHLLSFSEIVSTAATSDIFWTQIATAAYSVWAIWILRSQGYITTATALKAAAIVAAGQLTVGTGATWIGLWYWREDLIARWGAQDKPTA